jgi:hypothetical protein
MENKKMSYLDKILRNLQENEAVKAADAAAEQRRKEAKDRNRRFKEAEQRGEEADRKASEAAAKASEPATSEPTTKKESLVYAFNRWAKHLGEAALAEEEDREKAAQAAGETVANPPRQEMDSDENIEKKRKKKQAMNDRIKGMFSGPSSQSKK